MKLDSKYFDKVRVKPGEEGATHGKLPPCDWPGCAKVGGHRAPKGRAREGEYHAFCLEHVQAYNKTYNYFEGMNATEVADWQKDALTGHRPTWRLGENSWAAHKTGRRAKTGGFRHTNGFHDPLGLFGGTSEPQSGAPNGRRVGNAELKALNTLGLDETADAKAVKRQYKTLVKRMHPDANGGSRVNEDKLRAVIQAYDYLRSTGYC
jgi:DnaJ-domain-containing protein 1